MIYRMWKTIQPLEADLAMCKDQMAAVIVSD